MYLGLCHNYTSTAAQLICLSLLEVPQHTATRSPSLSVAHDAIHRHVTSFRMKTGCATKHSDVRNMPCHLMLIPPLSIMYLCTLVHSVGLIVYFWQ